MAKLLLAGLLAAAIAVGWFFLWPTPRPPPEAIVPPVARPAPTVAPLPWARRVEVSPTPRPTPVPAAAPAAPALMASAGRRTLYGQVLSFRAPEGTRHGVLTIRAAGFNVEPFAARTLDIRVPPSIFRRVRGILKFSVPVGRLLVVRVSFATAQPLVTLTARSIRSVGPNYAPLEYNETAGGEDYGPGTGGTGPGPTSGGS